MNKIFKVIWSKVKGCYVVVSELAKANTKSTTGSKKLAHTMLAALVLTSIGSGIPGVAEAIGDDEIGVKTTNNEQGGIVSTGSVLFKGYSTGQWPDTRRINDGDSPFSILFGFYHGQNRMNGNYYYWKYNAGLSSEDGPYEWKVADDSTGQYGPHVARKSVIMGYMSGTTADRSVVIGNRAKAISDDLSADGGAVESVVIGSNATAMNDPFGINQDYINANVSKNTG